jgi:hypothetical protein
MNRKVSSVNLNLERALLGRGKSNIGIVDTTSFLREEHMTLGPHLNSQDMRKHTLLIAKSL